MDRYELVREIPNPCSNNQMRDVFIEEVETDDPADWVKQRLKGERVLLTVEKNGEEEIAIFAEDAGLSQKFIFTKL